MWADHPGLVAPDPEPPPELPPPRVVPPDDDVVDGNVADRTPNQSADKAPREQSEPQWERDDKGRLKRKSINFSKMSSKANVSPSTSWNRGTATGRALVNSTGLVLTAISE